MPSVDMIVIFLFLYIYVSSVTLRICYTKQTGIHGRVEEIVIPSLLRLIAKCQLVQLETLDKALVLSLCCDTVPAFGAQVNFPTFSLKSRTIFSLLRKLQVLFILFPDLKTETSDINSCHCLKRLSSENNTRISLKLFLTT